MFHVKANNVSCKSKQIGNASNFRYKVTYFKRPEKNIVTKCLTIVKCIIIDIYVTSLVANAYAVSEITLNMTQHQT